MIPRRHFITLLGGAAAWPVAARAQQGERMRRIGVLHTSAADDPHGQARNTAFLQALAQSGWIEGRNVRIDIRWSAADAERVRRYAAEMVTLAPDVILATGSAVVAPLLQATRSVPVVFALVPDPVGSGFVDSLARPGGNATGFMLYEYSTYGKYVELLKEVDPGLTRLAVLRDAAITSGIGQFGVIQAIAAALKLEVIPVNVRDAAEIEQAVTSFAHFANGGLLVTGSPLTFLHRSQIIALAARHKLPAVYYERAFVAGGGLLSYGSNFIDQYRRAAGYVDRILKGEKPGDLAVQAPTKYELVINLKTARALGLTVPDTLLARADEVIE
jgi:putative ABC transport system substrate-binding protein